MSVICPRCSQEGSQNQRWCAQCGASLTGKSRFKQVFSPGPFLKDMRMYHYLVALSFIPLGFFSLIDIDLISQGVLLLAVLFSTYLWLALIGRLVQFRAASPMERIQACFDVLDYFAMSCVLAFVEGFWFGFGTTALRGSASVPQFHYFASILWGSIGLIAFMCLIGMCLVCIAEVSHQGVGAHRDPEDAL